MNKIFLLGRLVANPEFKITEKGKQVSKFRLAVNNYSKTNTLFINIIVFDNQAEHIHKFIQKGTQVLIEGRLDMMQTEDKGTFYSVIANDVRFISDLKPKEETKNETKAV